MGNVYDHQRLDWVQDLPILKDQSDNLITPSNLLLNNNESHLIFKNEHDKSQLLMFDLETGKVVQHIKTGKDMVDFEKVANEKKNGQRDPD